MPKLTVEFSGRTEEAIDRAARRSQSSKADVLRRAISLYDYVDREVLHTPDRQLVVLSCDGTQIPIVIT
jgi:predicted transcriptional regulator